MSLPADRLTCEVVLDHLDQLAADEVGELLASRLHLHLDGCVACADEWQLALQLRTALGELPRFELSDRALADLVERARGEHRPPRHRTLTWLAAAAAVVILVLGGRMLWQPTAAPGDVERATADARTALALVAEVGSQIGHRAKTDGLHRARLPSRLRTLLRPVDQPRSEHPPQTNNPGTDQRRSS